METLDRILVEHPFFQGMETQHLDLIVGCASNVRYDPGQLLLREAEEANQFFLIRHGKVALEFYVAGRGPVSILTLGEGEVLGWSWLVPPYRASCDARAVELTRAIALDGKCLRGKCEEDHELGYDLWKRFSQVIVRNLEATRFQLLNVYDNR